VDSAACKTYADTEKTACAKDIGDAGLADSCAPGAATGTQDPDFTYVIRLICGGADGG
jgi:hypothetical protein